MVALNVSQFVVKNNNKKTLLKYKISFFIPNFNSCLVGVEVLEKLPVGG